jgi:hypothetical protein
MAVNLDPKIWDSLLFNWKTGNWKLFGILKLRLSFKF